MADRYLHKLLAAGAYGTLIHRQGHRDAQRVWADQFLAQERLTQVQADGGRAG